MQRGGAPGTSKRGGPHGGRSAPQSASSRRTAARPASKRPPGAKAAGKQAGKRPGKQSGKKTKRPPRPRDPEKERARREKEAERKRRKARRARLREKRTQARRERQQVRSARRRARRLALLLWVQATLYRLRLLVWPEYTRKLPKGKAVLVLVLNVAPFPGLGTIIYGKWERGVAQFLLMFIFLLGWVWSVMDGVRIVHKAFASDRQRAKGVRRAQPARDR